jgi:hypothetical protein
MCAGERLSGSASGTKELGPGQVIYISISFHGLKYLSTTEEGYCTFLKSKGSQGGGGTHLVPGLNTSRDCTTRVIIVVIKKR